MRPSGLQYKVPLAQGGAAVLHRLIGGHWLPFPRALHINLAATAAFSGTTASASASASASADAVAFSGTSAGVFVIITGNGIGVILTLDFLFASRLFNLNEEDFLIVSKCFFFACACSDAFFTIIFATSAVSFLFTSTFCFNIAKRS